MSVFYLENFLLISGISGFSFFAIENIQNLETTKNFQKLIFRGLFIWFSSTFQSILCVQDKTLKVLLNVIKEHLSSYQEAISSSTSPSFNLLDNPS